MSNREGSSPVITGCVIKLNQANGVGAMANGEGSNPLVSDCIFLGNHAGSNEGGAVYNTGSSPTFLNCLFTQNYARSNGGAVCNRGDASPTLTNCVFFRHISWVEEVNSCLESWNTVSSCGVEDTAEPSIRRSSKSSRRGVLVRDSKKGVDVDRVTNSCGTPLNFSKI